MAVGRTTTDSLQDSLPTIIGQSRLVREDEGEMMSTVDRQTLGKGMGLTWHEVSYAKITAQAITEDTILDNPQQLSDTDFPLTPTVIGIETLITDRVGDRIVAHGAAKLGKLAQNAMTRKKLQDGITAIDGFTTSLGGSGTLTYGHIMAASVRITGNTTESGPSPLHAQLHAFQIKDLTDEMTAPVGTYNITAGPTMDAYKNGFKGMIGNVSVHENNEITITSNVAKGGVYSKMALVLVQGRSPRAVAVRREDIGGGATIMYHYDEYIWGERSSGNWGYELQTDATVPTS
ncbi:hypothetical protein CMI37_14955 [Candidatus Pacearchaeota archaeon]|nr:hypothetical protein [Candidatus Pacearchaeota archaeon]